MQKKKGNWKKGRQSKIQARQGRQQTQKLKSKKKYEKQHYVDTEEAAFPNRVLLYVVVISRILKKDDCMPSSTFLSFFYFRLQIHQRNWLLVRI